MRSSVTTRFQATILKAMRERLGIPLQDSLEWVVEEGKAIVYPVHPESHRHRNTVTVGPGAAERDLERAKDAREEKYR